MSNTGTCSGGTGKSILGDADGRWPLDTRYPGVIPVEIDDEGEGRPSRWNTLRALRVLRWYEQAGS